MIYFSSSPILPTKPGFSKEEEDDSLVQSMTQYGTKYEGVLLAVYYIIYSSFYANYSLHYREEEMWHTIQSSSYYKNNEYLFKSEILKKQNNGAKIIIFSQWNQCLLILSHILKYVLLMLRACYVCIERII